MKGKALFGIGIIIALTSGLIAGWMLSGFLSKLMIPNDVKVQAMRVTVTVVDTGETFYFNIDDPMTRIIYYQSGGELLAVGSREAVDWQVALGHEDWPSQGKGDCADVILKISKVKSPSEIRFEVGCLGGWNKKVYFDRTILKLDTSTGSRWTTWATPAT